jgi:release factor glutamine methyltransferase
LTLHTALLQGAALLEEARVPASRLTAEVLLAHAIRREREYLYAHPEETLTELGWIQYGRYLHQRLNGMPTQYVTGRQEFYGRMFRVTRDVLIPRPETEHVVEAALDRIAAGALVLDVGTGSGALAVTLALETRCRAVASDISAKALAVARANAARLEAEVAFVEADLLEPFAGHSIDAIVSNPPYVAMSERDSLQREVRDFEPPAALFSGPTGLECYERIVAGAATVLRPRGWLLLELGFRAATPVQAMLGSGWEDVALIPDLAGIPRVLAARRA